MVFVYTSTRNGRVVDGVIDIGGGLGGWLVRLVEKRS